MNQVHCIKVFSILFGVVCDLSLVLVKGLTRCAHYCIVHERVGVHIHSVHKLSLDIKHNTPHGYHMFGCLIH